MLYNSVPWNPALLKAVITDRLPKGGKLVGIGRIGVVTISILGLFLLFMEMEFKVDKLT